MKATPTILILEDNRIDADLIRRELKRNNPDLECIWVDKQQTYLQTLQHTPVNCVISDYSLPAYNGVEALKDLRAISHSIPFIIISGTLGDERAVEIVKMGAFDFVLKDSIKRLPVTVENALNEVTVNQAKEKAQQELRETVKQLARSNEELSQFAFVASHDMKTPVSNLMKLVELFEDLDGIQPHCLDLFEKTKQSVHRMDQTIRTLNKVISLKQSHNAIEKSILSFKEEFEEVKSSLEFQIAETGAEINIDFGPCPHIWLGKVHLQSIFQNLLSNALKYRLPSRSLMIDVQTWQTDDHICLYFSDNGEGIDLNAYGEKVFGLFQRFNLSIEGMGVGLHMLKSIVENSGGHIELESQPLVGTSFYLYFPSSNLPDPILPFQTESVTPADAGEPG